MAKLILLRHGQSIYNERNLFTGWTDIDLSEKGEDEAKMAGEILYQNSLFPAICFTSYLKRSIHTAQIVLHQMNWEHIDSLRSWKLNERHYGDWQERDKDEVKKEVGEEKFLAIRRGYEVKPPPLKKEDKRSPRNDPKYKALRPSSLPRSESLKDTKMRVMNYFYESIVPSLLKSDTVLVSAHGNSLRALVMEIEKLSAEEIVKVEIPTGVPIVYIFDKTLTLDGKYILKSV